MQSITIPPQSNDFLSSECSHFSSEGCDPYCILKAFFALFQWQITITQFELHFVPLGKHLADLQECLALCLWDNQPDVDQCDETDEGEDDEAVGAQTSLKGEGGVEMWAIWVRPIDEIL